MIKVHRYEVMYYSTGGWLKRVTVEARTRDEAIKVTRMTYDVIEMYRVRYID